MPDTGGSSATTTTRTPRRSSPNGSARGADRERPGARAGPGDDLAGTLDAVSLPALEDRADRRATVAMRELDRWTLGVGEVAIAPLRDRDQHGVEVEALRGEPVLVAHPFAGVLVGLAPQDVLLDQEGEPAAEHLARDAGVPAYVVEPAYAVEHLAQHHERPALAEDRHGAADRAVLGGP